ncbi:MAG: cytochrome c, partial [Thiotrichales bacterium]|nr:cytochrome c [Thiotrichales bacterium]
MGISGCSDSGDSAPSESAPAPAAAPAAKAPAATAAPKVATVAHVDTATATDGPSLSAADFERAKNLYFERCAGCHGVLRKGATGKNLEPKSTLELGQERLEKILTYGTEGGMNNFDDIFSKEEISLLATYIQLEPPVPPEMSLAMMKEATKT